MDIKVGSSTSFALDFCKHLKGKDNVFFSPASIYTALSLTAAGSAGATLEEFKKVLGFENLSEIENLLNVLQPSLQSDSKSFVVSTANRVYAGVSDIAQNYIQFVDKYFKAGIQSVDFNQSELVRSEINKWVSTQTRDKIPELLNKDSISPQTKMVLVNALYLKGDWLHKFDAKLTSDFNFQLVPFKEQSSIKVKMMTSLAEYRYGKFNRFQYIQIPYQNDKYAMEIFLPNNTLLELEESFTAQDIVESKDKSKKIKIKLIMPKFKMQDNTNAVETLKKLGLKEAFTDHADFSQLSEKTPLIISDVIHQAVVEVNELGTEAAAATAVVMTKACLFVKQKDPEMLVNRPFLFTISHIPTKEILFMGKISNPKSLQ